MSKKNWTSRAVMTSSTHGAVAVVMPFAVFNNEGDRVSGGVDVKVSAAGALSPSVVEIASSLLETGWWWR